MRGTARAIALLLALAALPLASGAQELRVVTEDWPPFDYLENGRPQGLAVEMVQALLEDSGLKAPIEFQPWNRAFGLIQRQSNVAVFSMARTPEREALFHWIFRIAPREIWLVRLASRADIKVSKLEDARSYMIGVGPLSDASTQDLFAAGFRIGGNLDSVEGADPDRNNVQKLFMGRVDLIVGNPFSLAYSAKRLGLDYSKVVNVLKLSGGTEDYWLALNASSSPALEKRLLESAARLEKTGVFKAIRERYLK